MSAEDLPPDIVEARREYLRQQEREKKRRQRARKRLVKIAQAEGLEVPGLSPDAVQSHDDEKPEPAIDPPRPMGRPKLFTPEKALKWQDFICSRIREGKTLTAILRAQPKGPSIDTVYRWLGGDATFAAAYERAKVDAAESLFFQGIEIEEAATGDAAAISAARMRSEVRRYAAAKLKPEKYADRSEVHASGEVKHVITDDQRARALAAFIARQAIGAAQSLPEVRKLIEQKTGKDQTEDQPKP